MYILPCDQHLTPEWYICYGWGTYIDTSLSVRVRSLHKGSLLVFYIL